MLVPTGISHPLWLTHLTDSCETEWRGVAVLYCSRLGHTPLPPSPINNADYDEFGAVRLEDIEVITTLGMGGFGRVELVCGVRCCCSWMSGWEEDGEGDHKLRHSVYSTSNRTTASVSAQGWVVCGERSLSSIFLFAGHIACRPQRCRPFLLNRIVTLPCSNPAMLVQLLLSHRCTKRCQRMVYVQIVIRCCVKYCFAAAIRINLNFIFQNNW